MKSLLKVRDILVLVASEQGVGLPDLSKKLAMPKSTVYRLLRALHKCGFVMEEAGHTYRLGPLVSDLALGYSRRERLIRAAHQSMVKLRDACDETVALHVLEGNSRLVLHQVVSTQELRRTFTNIGVPMPLGATAAGKLFLAFMPQQQSTAYLKDHPLTKYTRKTPSAERLAKEIKDIRQQGYAVSFEEMVEGVAGIAMPVRGIDGAVAVALGVSGPLSRFSKQDIDPMLLDLKSATESVSQELSKGED
jgi:IclR family acetate operon transcriptional repressor